MPENEGQGQGTAPPNDDKNIKAEMDRKFSNLADQFKKSTDALAAQIASLAAAPKKEEPRKETKSTNWKETFYEDENKAAALLKEETKEELRQELRAESRQNEVVAGLYRDYPELADANNDLTKKALEVLKTYSETERKNPTTYRLAVLEAATELNVMPSHKRMKAEDDDFTMGGDRGQSRMNKGKKRESDLSDETLGFAELMGLDTSDPKVVERLKESANRDTWYKYRPVIKKK